MRKKTKLGKKENTNKGITLITLVITIIILLILAGISIASLTGENGILNKAQQAGEKTEQAQAKEKLELVLLALQTEKLTNPQYNENDFIDNSLLNSNMQVEDDIVTSDGYQFEIDRTVPKIINELGKVTEESLLMPMIRKITPTQGHTEINIKLDIVNKEGATITYSIQKEGETQVKERVENKIELEYTFSGLEIDTKYIIMVEVTNEYGTRKKSITVTTKKPTIQLSDTSLALKINEIKQLTYTIIPNNSDYKNVKWFSSDSDIVTIDDNGKVTAIKEGKTSITAMVEDGSYESATCTVKVVKPNYIVQNGKWEESVVGGWNSFVINSRDSFVQYQDTYIDLLCSFANNRVGVNSVNKIDVTDTEFITANVELNSNCYNATTLTSSLYIGLCSTVDDTITNFEQFDLKSTKANTVQNFELSFDTKDLEGDYYLKVVAVHGKEESAYTVLGKVYDIIAWK